MGSDHPAAANWLVHLQGASRAPRETSVESVPVSAVVHAREAGRQYRVARHRGDKPGREHHRRLQPWLGSRPGKRRPPPRARVQRGRATSRRHRARNHLELSNVDAVQREGRSRYQWRRAEHGRRCRCRRQLPHRLRARDDEEHGKPQHCGHARGRQCVPDNLEPRANPREPD